MYTIKLFPSDFIVEEIMNLKLEKDGKYRYFILEKVNYDTNKAISLISKKLNTKKINYSGIKDKKAITKQYISINHPVKEKDYDFGDIRLYYVGRGNTRLNLGTHTGNRFSITIREVSKRFPIRTTFPNYFGDQRFSKNNIMIGKLLLKKKYKEACESLFGSCERPIEKLRQLKTLRLYVASVQSYAFNMLLSEYIKRKAKTREVKKDYGTIHYPIDEFYEDIELPMIGFDSKEGIEEIRPKDFINRQIPNLTMEETLRKGFVEAKDLSYEWNGNTLKIRFALPKSSYATVFIENMVDQ